MQSQLESPPRQSPPVRHRHRYTGVVLWALLGFIILVVGYVNRPDAQTCQTINSIDSSLGSPSTCSSNPPTGFFVAAGICAAIALFLLARNVWHNDQQ